MIDNPIVDVYARPLRDLFANQGYTLRERLPTNASDSDTMAYLAALLSARSGRYSEMRSSQPIDIPKVELSYIGG